MERFKEKLPDIYASLSKTPINLCELAMKLKIKADELDAFYYAMEELIRKGKVSKDERGKYFRWKVARVVEWDEDLIEFQEIELLLEGLEIEGEY